MNLPYVIRLVILCTAAFFLIHTALALAVSLIAGRAIRLAEGMKASTAARFLFAVRILPLLLTLLAVFGLCVPSYLWLEPGASPEKVGLVCVLAALLGALACGISMRRVVSAIAGTMSYVNRCEQAGHPTMLPGDNSPVLVLDQDVPVLAIAGVVHPRLVVSRRVVQSLSPEQIDAALSHERGHQISRDNFKRLLILFTPDVFPFVRGFTPLERGWAKFSEWAADDHAAAGDSHRALCLAAALVTVAKMNARPQLPSLVATLMADDRDLSERIDRLLHSQPVTPTSFPSLPGVVSSAAALLSGAFALMVVWPGSLAAVHQALERLVR